MKEKSLGVVTGAKGLKITDHIEVLKGLGILRKDYDGGDSLEYREAVKGFQRMHPPLKVDGVVGVYTNALLHPKPIADRKRILPELIKSFSDIPHMGNLRRFYGEPGENQVYCETPYPMVLAWDMSKRIDKFLCHAKIKDKLEAIFRQTLRTYGAAGVSRLNLDKFGGCFNYRNMRGSKNLSTHAWGIAVDLDPAHNQLRTRAPEAAFSRPDYRPFWDIVYANGAISLGIEKGYDYMHFQFARL